MVVALLTLSLVVVLGNWGAAVVSLWNKRRGVDRHISPFPFAAQLFAVLAAAAAFSEDRGILPVWAFILVPLLDPALWGLLYLPFANARHRQ
jgi:biotin transporter BioY